jgi:hypothetical protein
MNNGHKRRPRGRPRLASTSELVNALTAKQVAMAERVASRINALLAAHVRRADVSARWLDTVGVIRAKFETLPNRIATTVPGVDVAVVRVLLDDALEELVVTAEDRALAALPPEPPEKRAIVLPAATLTEARAQLARLQTRLMDLRGRISRGEPR